MCSCYREKIALLNWVSDAKALLREGIKMQFWEAAMMYCPKHEECFK